MSRNRRRDRGRGGPGAVVPGPIRGEAESAAAVPPRGELRRPGPSGTAGAAVHVTGPGTARSQALPGAVGPPVPVAVQRGGGPSPRALESLALEISRFNRSVTDIIEIHKGGGRSGEDRKEMWVLLSALTVVVVFCFVAFYMNQAEVRDLHAGLQSEIQEAGQAASSSVDRKLSSLHLEKVPEAQATLDRFLREKDRRDGERLAEIRDEVRRASEGLGARLRDDVLTLQGEVAALRRSIDEAKKGPSAGTPAPASAPLAEGHGPVAAMVQDTTSMIAGRTARAPDGPPSTAPPDSAGRPPGRDGSGGDSAFRTGKE